MNSRLDRLMRLFQKTGNTLIVQNESGRDMVLMDVDEYEVMYDMFEMDRTHDGRYDDCACGYEDTALHEMSEREMLDKINRDIAIWRAHREMDDEFEKSKNIEENLKDNPPFDPFEEDLTHSPEWHKVSDVLGDRHSELPTTDEVQDEYLWDEDDEEEISIDDLPDFDELDDDVETDLDLSEEESHDEMVYDELGEDEIFSEKKDEREEIPFVPQDDTSLEFKEEPLSDDEPVFFEEPV